MSGAKLKVLILEDDKGLLTQYRWLLSDYIVQTAETRKQAVELASREHPAIAIVDLGLPPDPDGASEGLAAVAELLEIAAGMKVIVVSGNDLRENASKAIVLGAYDFFQKPADPELLKLIVGRAARLYELEQENHRLVFSVSQTAFDDILGNSDGVQKLRRDISRVAKTDIAILLTGESGTGKELVANAIHRASSRNAKPFVAINCAAIPENLLEAELFGHEKGAFTGAIKQTIGKIESAKNGTLFLDEIGDLPLATQVKLLRFLEDGIIERLGGRLSINVDARILTATNQDLSKLIGEGRFREDLYYRINEFSILLPPLRERTGDIILLANFFLRRFAKEIDRSFRGFSRDALEALRQHPWRGNVRELENRVKRAAVMAENSLIAPADLDLAPPAQERSFNLREARHRAEIEVINVAMSEAGGNISKTAALLGISRPTLYELLQQHGISSTRGSSSPQLAKES